MGVTIYKAGLSFAAIRQHSYKNSNEHVAIENAKAHECMKRLSSRTLIGTAHILILLKSLQNVVSFDLNFQTRQAAQPHPSYEVIFEISKYWPCSIITIGVSM